MDAKNTANLPDGVGKKIIEALKKQSEQPVKNAQIEQQPQFDDFMTSHEEFSYDEGNDAYNYEKTAETPLWSENNSGSSNSLIYDDFNIEMDDINAVVDDEENYDFSSQKDSFDYNYDENASAEEETTTYNPLDDEEGQTEESEFTYPQIEYEEVSEIPAPKINLDYKEPTVSYQEPEAFNSEDNTPSESLNLDQNSNVTILMRLISGLPAGVTRQTGAQIIRQTMEAMGISMNNVLSEAQTLQDELSSSVRSNINKIEEYKRLIRELEKSTQSFKNQSEELQDLISLFVVSDK